MKSLNFKFISIVAAMSTLLLSMTMGSSVTAQTAEQIRKMRAGGAPVVLPSYVPQGFRLTNFKIDVKSVKPPDIYNNNYEAIFKGSNNCQFEITGESHPQWGGEGPVHQWIVNTNLFGKITLEESDGSYANSPNYLIAQAGAGEPKSVPGFPNAGYTFNFSCRNSVFNYKTAIEIIKSLRVVK
jgi:hypothetical protein